MAEYTLIVALMALGTLGVISIFGDGLRALLGGSTTALTGDANESTPTVPPPGALRKNVKGTTPTSTSYSSGGAAGSLLPPPSAP